jgi:hypothetical protein
LSKVFTLQFTNQNGPHNLLLSFSFSVTSPPDVKTNCYLCSELRVELDLPGSALEDVDLSQTFPLPPTLDGQLSDSETDVTERGWYYYLAEIAARHLINRMLRARSWTQAVPSSEEIWRMLADVELFETQLREWHSSLPPMLKFDIPEGPFIQTYSDELKQILRHRYLTSRELIYRPFVRLCVEHELDSLEPHLRAAVATLASNGLQYCMYKISQVLLQRHQGTWFMIRNYATNSMIMLAVSKARNNPRFLGAASIIVPEGWRDRILQTMLEIGPCWDDGPGGVGEIRRLVEWALATET